VICSLLRFVMLPGLENERSRFRLMLRVRNEPPNGRIDAAARIQFILPPLFFILAFRLASKDLLGYPLMNRLLSFVFENQARDEHY